MSNFRGGGVFLIFFPNFNRLFCKHIVKAYSDVAVQTYVVSDLGLYC